MEKARPAGLFCMGRTVIGLTIGSPKVINPIKRFK